MNVVSENNEVFNASVSVQTIEGYSGLVMESRGGAKGGVNERNTDYLLALEVILSRIFKLNIRTIKVFLVPKNALKIWPSMAQRALEVEGSTDIKLSPNTKELKKLICKAQKDKKKKFISANLDDPRQWEFVGLGRTPVHIISEDEISEKAFDPKDAEKVKEKIIRSIANRRGQAKFRKKLLKIYDGKCAISATNLPPILEAAHIVPYQGENTNNVTNGILLRSDFHLLFDFVLIGINNAYKVVVSSSLSNTEYAQHHASNIFLPKEKSQRPSREALDFRPLPYRQ